MLYIITIESGEGFHEEKGETMSVTVRIWRFRITLNVKYLKRR